MTGGIGGAAGAAGAEAGLLSKAFSLLPATFLAAGIIAAAVPIGQAFANALPDWLKGPGGQGMSESQTRILAARAAQNAGSPGLNTPLLDRGGREPGKDNFIVAGGYDKRIAQAVLDGFKRVLATLRTSRDPKTIENAMKEVVKTLITQSKGSVNTTKASVASLKEALKHVTDPKLRAELKTALAKVQAKIPGREYAQKQVNAALKLINDGKVTRGDLKSIQGIERDLKNRGLPHAASVIQASVDKAKNAEVQATNASKQAIVNAVAAQSITTVVNAVFSLRTFDSAKVTKQNFSGKFIS